MMFAKTTIKEVKLDIALKLFECYVQPIFDYNLHVWSSDFRLSYDKDINAVFAMFLKRYMGLNYGTKSSIVHFLTETQPLTNSLLEKAKEKIENIEKINLSFHIDHKELLLVKVRERKPFPKYSPIELIPTGFWQSEVLKGSLPANSKYRARTCNKLVDGRHWEICQTKEFHYNHSNESCKCQFCNEPAEWFHECKN